MTMSLEVIKQLWKTPERQSVGQIAIVLLEKKIVAGQSISTRVECVSSPSADDKGDKLEITQCSAQIEDAQECDKNADSIGCDEHRRATNLIEILAAHAESLHNVLRDRKKFPNREHSVCFGCSLEVTSKVPHADAMTLDSSNDKLHDNRMKYARDFKDHGQHTT